MIIGVVKEIKDQEYRVGMVPSGVRTLVSAGHRVLVQQSAGEGSGISDGEYQAAGAEIVAAAAGVYEAAEMIVKVKEPLQQEYELLREGQLLYTYLHLAPAPELAAALLRRKVIGVAYETIQLASGALPLLTPMSEVAGRLSIQAGARCLQKNEGGRGVLLGGVPGVPPARVVIVGGGVVGTNAAKMAVGMGADVTLFDINLDRLRYLDDIFGGRLKTMVSNAHDLAEALAGADLVIGAVLVVGAKAPHLITSPMVEGMKPGSVIVDVAIDQGGCSETSRPTSHSHPTYEYSGVIHYCVTNMPGAVARTSTFALTNATLPYALRIANQGLKSALQDPALAKGLNVYRGQVTHPAVARDLGYTYVAPAQVG